MSRKLIAAVVGMAAIVGVVIGAAIIGNVPENIVLTALVLIAGLGGFQIVKQAEIDRQ